MNDTAENPAPPDHHAVGTEASKTIEARYRSGFVARYLSGANILDIGYRGYFHNAVPIVPQAIGIDLEYPGYDGRTLPFEDNSQDAVFSSHCLEHIDDYKGALREWHRVLRVGGFMVVSVPHQFLYEKRSALPSRWNQDHKRFYTPASLMAEVESALAPNSYRLRHLVDNDLGFTYASPPEIHSGGCYEIEMVLEKTAEPPWNIVPDLVEIDIGPDSELIEWIGFSACEPGYRWTDSIRASMQFQLSAEQAQAVLAAKSRISCTINTFGRQRISVSVNGVPVLHKTLDCKGLVLRIPACNVRPGLNTIYFDLPDATRPASEADQRHLGMAVGNVRLVRVPRQHDPAPEKIGMWDTVLRLFGRT